MYEGLSLLRLSYNGYYPSLPSWRRGFDSHQPLKFYRNIQRITRMNTNGELGLLIG